MKLLTLLTIAGAAAVQSSTSSTADSSSSAAAPTSVSPDYTITAIPAVQSAPSCVFNCLIPIGLADASGCDDVSEDCACLSAPADVLNFLTDCVNTVCASSPSAYGASATSLYDSYCQSVYGNATISQAFAVESSADAAVAANNSIASAEASTTSSNPNSKSSSGVTNSLSRSTSAAATEKSVASVWSPSLLTVGSVVIGGLVLVVGL